VLRQDGPGKRVNLDLEGNAVAGALETQIEATNPGEQTADGHHVPSIFTHDCGGVKTSH
jgi:hypothetical protein